MKGWKSPKYGHLGVYFLCTGPDPNGPMPGERVRVVIYDEHGSVVRRFEQIGGVVLDEGYVDFFGGPRDRPVRQRMPVVDIAPDGAQTVLIADFQPTTSREIFANAFRTWAETHGARGVKIICHHS